ncbi:MAG: substrate-binding domain-containing protein [Nitrospinota bacterium]
MWKALLAFGLLLSLLGWAEGGERLRLATTTSTENSGLLASLNPPFEKRFSIRVDVIAVGTGKALLLGRTGDVDVVLVHARAAEDEFVAEGFGVNRRDVMYNDFVLLGPPEDPAGIKGCTSAGEALKAIAAKRAPFISRGDDSGTHKKELLLWKKAGVLPRGAWYAEAGQGMGAVLRIADEKGAYTLTDRGTYLSRQEGLELPILVEGDHILFNPYGVIAVNPERHPHVKYELATKFIQWLTSVDTQEKIGQFRHASGEPLFHPNSEQWLAARK